MSKVSVTGPSMLFSIGTIPSSAFLVVTISKISFIEEQFIGVALESYLIVACSVLVPSGPKKAIDFVLKNASSKSSIENLLVYEVSGVKTEYLLESLISNFGSIKNENDKRFRLGANIEETVVKTTIETNQVSTTLQYTIVVNYELIDLNEDCKTVNKRYEDSFTHYPKSQGYNFGTDLSLQKTYKNYVNSNVLNFKTYLETNQDFISCSITPKSSSSHFHIFVFPIRTENRAGIEGNFRVSDGTNVTERYRAQSDSSNGYYTWNPITWYWPLAKTAGTAYTFTVQCRVGGGSGASVTIGDQNSTSRMIIYEIAQ